MEMREFLQVLAAVVLMTVVGSFSFVVDGQWIVVPGVLFFSVLIIFTAVFSKKAAARLLDCDVEHEFWMISRDGIKPGYHFKREVPAGIIFPLFFSLFSLGILKFCAFLTYEARALKRRAAKRFGVFSYSSLTEWHNGLIGAAGVIGVLALATIAYFLPYDLQYFSKLGVFYAFSNMLPFGKLDGSQILFGSKTLYTSLAVLTLIFLGYALLIL